MGRGHPGRLPSARASLIGHMAAAPRGPGNCPDAPRDPASKVLDRMDALGRAGPGRSFRLVFTNGCFDLLHAGHVACLDAARRLGDRLLVGLNSDDSVRRQGKGPGRPVVSERRRAAVVAALESVDWVVVFDEDTPALLVDELVPDVLVKGGDYDGDAVAGAAAVRAAGGQVVVVPFVSGESTTALLERIRDGASVPRP